MRSTRWLWLALWLVVEFVLVWLIVTILRAGALLGWLPIAVR